MNHILNQQVLQHDNLSSTKEVDDESKGRMKGCLDIAAGAVLITSLTAAAIGGIVFIRKLLILFHIIGG